MGQSRQNTIPGNTQLPIHIGSAPTPGGGRVEGIIKRIFLDLRVFSHALDALRALLNELVQPPLLLGQLQDLAVQTLLWVVLGKGAPFGGQAAAPVARKEGRQKDVPKERNTERKT